MKVLLTVCRADNERSYLPGTIIEVSEKEGQSLIESDQAEEASDNAQSISKTKEHVLSKV